ncbi:MAG: DNA polymerase IV [Saccharospirillaceae bacterium]|nr:DNA polymerase IV [Pseudomonadales bacterium]NRB78308.1 DNA polymerase IV [Saccharospirillaceae bacterium]
MSQSRKFIHIDMDCFFAAVEMKKRPELKNIPMAIGGSTKRRGVIATCNYPARYFGIHSAMATSQALKLCPQLVLVPGSMKEYSDVSQQIMAILRTFTDQVEVVSVDEAFLDVTDCELFDGSATLIAQAIRARILLETGLTASAGIAPLRFVAKIASDENKPDGIFVVSPKRIDEFVAGLALKKIPGVGKVTQEKLKRYGLSTCQNVRDQSLNFMIDKFGKFGLSIWQKSHAIDKRGLSFDRERKSVGVEHTLSDDINSFEQCCECLFKLLERLKERLQDKTKYGVTTIGVKLKFNDFKSTSVEQKTTQISVDLFKELLQQALLRKENRSIRLVGIFVNLPSSYLCKQLELFEKQQGLFEL